MFRELSNDLQGRFLVYLPTLLTEVFLFPLNRAQFSSSSSATLIPNTLPKFLVKSTNSIHISSSTACKHFTPSGHTNHGEGEVEVMKPAVAQQSGCLSGILALLSDQPRQITYSLCGSVSASVKWEKQYLLVKL